MTYAVRGIFFFFAHPSLWTDAFCPFLLLLLLSVGASLAVLIVLFPLFAHLFVNNAHMHPAGAWTLALILALLLCAIISLILFAALPSAYLTNAFTRTLMLRGCRSADLLRSRDNSRSSSIVRSSRACVRVSILLRILISLGTLPVNALPVLGTIAWCYMNGVILLWEYHQTWFDLYGLDYEDQKRWIAHHKTAYSYNGIVAQALEMIPFFNWFFCWTNAVGSALMAADWEQNGEYPQASTTATIQTAPLTLTQPQILQEQHLAYQSTAASPRRNVHTPLSQKAVSPTSTPPPTLQKSDEALVSRKQR